MCLQTLQYSQNVTISSPAAHAGLDHSNKKPKDNPATPQSIPHALKETHLTPPSPSATEQNTHNVSNITPIVGRSQATRESKNSPVSLLNILRTLSYYYHDGRLMGLGVVCNWGGWGLHLSDLSLEELLKADYRCEDMLGGV